jgi:hypothetical protein
MAKLYIANTSQQTQTICYRLDVNDFGMPGVEMKFKAHRTQQIAMGRQEMLGSADFTIDQIERIVQQLFRFGLVATAEAQAGRLPRAVVPYVFNVDRPVPGSVFHAVVEHNRLVQIDDGKYRRKAAAVAAANSVKKSLETNLGINDDGMELEVSIEQDNQSELGERTIEEGYRVTPRADGREPAPVSRAAARKAKRRPDARA